MTVMNMDERRCACGAYTVAHFHSGNLIRVYLQHRYGRICLGQVEEWDVADWLAVNVPVGTGWQPGRGADHRDRRPRGGSSDDGERQVRRTRTRDHGTLN